MKKIYIIVFLLLTIFVNEEIHGQSSLTSYTSNKYGYSINIPKGFSQTSASGRNIDLKLIQPDGTNILINVTPRRPEEYNITAHDYSKEMLEKEFRQYTPSITVSKAEKVFIDGEKAFLIHYNNSSNNTKALEIYTYRGTNAYVLTATTKTNQFASYESVFLKAFNSIKFK
jgi:hypothetical protein